MKTRPQLHIRLCGLAAGSDYEALLGTGFETLQKEPEQAAPGEKETSGIKAEKPVELDTQPLSDEKLQELVRQRALAIKEYLVQQHGIAPDRLVVCNPELDRDKDGKPRVELLI